MSATDALVLFSSWEPNVQLVFLGVVTFVVPIVLLTWSWQVMRCLCILVRGYPKDCKPLVSGDSSLFSNLATNQDNRGK